MTYPHIYYECVIGMYLALVIELCPNFTCWMSQLTVKAPGFKWKKNEVHVELEVHKNFKSLQHTSVTMWWQKNVFCVSLHFFFYYNILLFVFLVLHSRKLT